MKGNIFDIKRFSFHDGPGIRTTIFLKGCPLKCSWCHNPEGINIEQQLMFMPENCIGKSVCKIESCPGKEGLSKIKGQQKQYLSKTDFVDFCPSNAVKWNGKLWDDRDILQEVLKDKAYYDVSRGGVTISGGEPTLQIEFLHELLKTLKHENLHVTLDTCAHIPWYELNKIAQYVDLFLVDIKIINQQKHLMSCGVNNNVILQNIRELCNGQHKVMVRIPLIPGHTDQNENLESIAKFVKTLDVVPHIEILPYHTFGFSKYHRMGMDNLMKEIEIISENAVDNAHSILKAHGLSVFIQNQKKNEASGVLGDRNKRLKATAIEMKDSKIPWDRSFWFTKGYKVTDEQEPVIIRRAKALKVVFENVQIYIRPDELIIGEQLRTVPGPKGVAEEHRWVKGVTSPETSLNIDFKKIPPEVVDELIWWKDRNHKHIVDSISENTVVDSLRFEGVFEGPKNYYGHIIPDFRTALDKGYIQIKKEAYIRMEELREQNKLSKSQEDFYFAVIIVCDGVIKFGERYEMLALKLAKEETNNERKDELENLAQVFARVPAYPPNTFQQALQMVWFVHYFNEEEAPAVNTHSFGRFDQYLYPFYQKDVLTNGLTRERALELVEGFWIKCYRTFEQQHTMLGGITPEGEEGVNELTFICLEAVKNVGFPKAVGVRINENSSDDYLKKVVDVLACGMGVPSIFNDGVIIKALTDRGLSKEHARDYGVTGCIELAVPGEAEFLTVGLFVNFAKILELALNKGISMLTQKQISIETDEMAKLLSFEDLLEAFRQQLVFLLDIICKVQYKAEILIAESQPMPLLSSLMRPCMEKGIDTTAGGAMYNFTGVCVTEIATTVNSLAAIKQFVFEDNKWSLYEFTNILKNNFEGFENVRQQLIHKTNKFGNDCNEVDELAVRILKMFDVELRKQKHPRGGEFIPLIFSRPQRQDVLGKTTAATADGRKAGETTAVSLNPQNGTAQKGLTAIFNSQNHLPLELMAGGVSNNLDLHPSVLIGNGQDKMIYLLRGWCKSGGMEVALQIADAETLRKAQEEPENFRDLSVRIYGFSEMFVELDKKTQDYVIARTEGYS